jgi:hypothetical protein
MADDIKPKERDWIDVALKASTPVIVGLVLAIVGFWSNQTLSEISSREESARLITQLQVEREQAETNLRKDIFDQALQALFNPKLSDGSSQDLSKRLLRLEMLALNFGDSLSLSPLFIEFKRDLNYAEKINQSKEVNFREKVSRLRKRLFGLAKRVGSGQLSSLGQQGRMVNFRVPLDQHQIDDGGDCPRARKLLVDHNYSWPYDEIRAEAKGTLNAINPSGDPSEEELEDMMAIIRDGFTRDQLILDNVVRSIKVDISQVERCSKTVTVALTVSRNLASKGHTGNAQQAGDVEGEEGPGSIDEVEREFQLDFFNFPVVDNTRLSHNHRFAIVMEEFWAKRLDDDEPYLEISGVIFPAEYASLKDRPGMKEAMQLLQSALQIDSNDPKVQAR